MEVYLTKSQLNRRRRWRRVKIYFILGGIAALVVFGYYLVALSRAFKVNLEIDGLRRLPEERLVGYLRDAVFHRGIAKFLGEKNYFSWPGKIKINDPLLAGLKVDKSWLEKKIIITVEERLPYGIWCFESAGCFWFDEGGLIFDYAPDTEGHLILKISSDEIPSPPIVGQKAVAEAKLETIKKILRSLSETGISSSGYFVISDLEEFRTKTAGGAQLRFSLRLPPENPLAALKLLQEKGELRGAEYVDLTVENRVYIKGR